VDCREPPCFAITYRDAAEPPRPFTTDCPAYKDLFDSEGLESLTVVVPCSGGPRRVTMFTPAEHVVDGVVDEVTPNEVVNRTEARFSESLDLEALCALDPSTSP
jgi:hypothetical protein